MVVIDKCGECVFTKGGLNNAGVSHVISKGRIYWEEIMKKPKALVAGVFLRVQWPEEGE